MVKSDQRIRFEAAREVAEQLAVVVGQAEPDAAASWLAVRVRDENFSLNDLCLVLASMVPEDPGYTAAVKERFDPGPTK